MPRRHSGTKRVADDDNQFKLDLLARDVPAEDEAQPTLDVPAPSPTEPLSQQRSSRLEPLVISVAPEPFRWFADGERCWELRRYGREFTERDIMPGRAVELRRGHRPDDALSGVIVEVLPVGDLAAFFDQVSHRELIPVAGSLDEATEIAQRLLGTGNLSRLIGFRISFE